MSYFSPYPTSILDWFRSGWGTVTSLADLREEQQREIAEQTMQTAASGFQSRADSEGRAAAAENIVPPVILPTSVRSDDIPAAGLPVPIPSPPAATAFPPASSPTTPLATSSNPWPLVLVVGFLVLVLKGE